eukprot:CAMPEP_0175011044 /NCGR_PEP_ID=MMETSP0005-20121125/8434_1 /TAXON_ID=420556 /ORGANISM="Ochromonas sp., Strain CCMP1393" /LENGTH=75 /DNA_ID=CAMNT_0016266925 /DNA_START=286 /DNA_END=509 /DNA_ORIENTATION=+
MASSGSSSLELYEKIALIQAWQAVDRLIAAVTHEVNNSEVAKNGNNYNKESGMITVLISNYSEFHELPETSEYYG